MIMLGISEYGSLNRQIGNDNELLIDGAASSTAEMTQTQLQQLNQVFLRTEFQQCTYRDNKYLFRALLSTFQLILILTFLIYICFKIDDTHVPNLKRIIGYQICISLGILLTLFWTKLAGFFLSFTAFTVPFFVLISTG